MSSVVFITGVSSGIGQKTAELAIQGGCAVIGVDIEVQNSIILNCDDDYAHYVGSVTDREFIFHVLKEASLRFGKIHKFFNNAGILGFRTEIHKFKLRDWEDIIGTNLTGMLCCLAEEIKILLKMGGGSIVNNASVSALYGSHEYPLYSSSKHGVVSLTKSVAIQYGSQGIRCNAICSSTVDSPMTKKELMQYCESEAQVISQYPMKRYAKTEEIAKIALWLLSSDSGYINGQSLLIDGGLSL